jgi:L1 cell adhesion molecule like protein
MIIVNCMCEDKLFHTERVSSIIPMKMKETAEAYLGTNIIDTVVTVPTYFDDVAGHQGCQFDCRLGRAADHQ